MKQKLNYLAGFGNQFQSEALPNALPLHQNSPQHVPYGLYAEQLSGSAFTAVRHLNLRSWLYRIRPSVLHGEFHPYTKQQAFERGVDQPPPTQMRWDPLEIPSTATTFLDGLRALADNGDGATIYSYVCNQSMTKQFFYNADGELLIVPQQGALRFVTEMGLLDIAPHEILVIPRGIKFSVTLQDATARGFVVENHLKPFRLPELGPIGANGLANSRNFLYPTAHFVDQRGDFQLIGKFQRALWCASLKHSPCDVVAWHGNYAPYKYDLQHFNTINTVSYDHVDPSIFTVLTSQTETPGIASVDFVIFPERWSVAENTFRPPYFHRNVMNEFMGLISGVYDAKGHGFSPGGFSLHNCMSAHGPDSETYRNALSEKLEPSRYKDTLAFMFESNQIWRPTPFALNCSSRQKDYLQCWQDLPVNFKTPHES